MPYKDGSFVINTLNEWHTSCDGIRLTDKERQNV